MGKRKLSAEQVQEIEEIAKGWGKILARESFPERPGLDVTFADMEDIAAAASKALVRGTLETMVGDQGEEYGTHQPCPTCNKSCEIDYKPRDVSARGGTATLAEPVGHCSTCRRDFFPSASSVKD